MSVKLGGRDYKITEDKGCYLWRPCSTCPLPYCIHDRGQKRLKQRTHVRYLEIASEYNSKPVTQFSLSRRHHCSLKTVERALKWYRSFGYLDISVGVIHTESLNPDL